MYEKISKISFPSLVDQFKNGFLPRDEIDQLFIDILQIKLSKNVLQNTVKQEIDDLRFLVKAND